ncbi:MULTISPECIES: glycogen synthase GlgA [unclassified Bradyrhizobium]|uniref:glycogen synthase GlgA n=1 Tax=unclassified Bradyrhizobium TaxID=2631580 RepID=UPI0028EE3687|nr:MULTISPECIES: glycogen synthase GlgA [unclassified Bradyrhizobium]
MTPLRVLSVASEVYPIVKTGGLADVVGALPWALMAEDVEVRTLIPGYPAVMTALEQASEISSLPNFFGGNARLLGGSHGALDLFVLDAPHLYDREGNPYLGPDGKDWPDNAFRFAALARAASYIGLGAVPAFVPDIVHGHDWQAGLVPAYLLYSHRPHPGTVMTVHNLAFQGRFPRHFLPPLGLPPESFSIYGLEYYGDISFLKAGLQFADKITTVSPTYAREIQSDEQGMGLGGLLRQRASDLVGILNGIDTAVWDPGSDSAIPSHFGIERIEARAPNKAALQTRMGLQVAPETFLLGVVSRLTSQKGLDLLLSCLPTLTGSGIQLALLGDGEAELRDAFRAAAAHHPGQIGVVIGYDESLAHLIQAGCDALVVPSRFEPCGLTQLCALRYGALPIVTAVGGLADTVIDETEAGVAATGFKCASVTAEALDQTLRRAAAAFYASRSNAANWTRMQLNAMLTDVSWRHRAGRYAELYRQIVAQRRPAA